MYVTCATGRNHLSVVVVSLIRSDDPESLILVTLAESATDGAIKDNNVNYYVVRILGISQNNF